MFKERIPNRMNNRILTIFTPTYNRAYTLTRLFESLQEQSCKNFEWLVCDDGSNDNTDKLMEHFIDKAVGFRIKYLKQSHGGKHRAQNKAIQYAQGEYFLTCDSNKCLATNAVESILRMFDTVDGSQKICGVGGYRANFKGQVYGGTLPENTIFLDCTNLEREKYNLSGDKASAFYTDLLRKYPFPEFEDEYFISESAWLTPMAMDGYQIRWFPRILVYGEYTEDGLTKQGANEYIGHFNNFEGFLYVLATEIKAYGVEKRLPEIYEAFSIARKKGISCLEAGKKLGFSTIQVIALKARHILGNIKRKLKKI